MPNRFMPSFLSHAFVLTALVSGFAANATSMVPETPAEQTRIEVSPAEMARQARELGLARGDLVVFQFACKHTDAQKARTLALDAELGKYFAKWGGNEAAQAYVSAKEEGSQRSKAVLKRISQEDLLASCEYLKNGFDKEIAKLEAFAQRPPRAATLPR